MNMNKYIELYREFKRLQKINKNENKYDVLIDDKFHAQPELHSEHG